MTAGTTDRAGTATVQPPVHRGRRIARVVWRTVVTLASVATVAVTGTAWSVQDQLGTDLVTSNAVTARPVAPGEAFTALLVGLDARTDAAGNPLPQAVLDALHAGPDEGQLHTDTIMLLHVPAAAGAPAVAISIPRDSFVPIAGDRGTHKINSAYGRGLADAQESLRAQGISGAELDRRGREAGRSALVATVEALTAVQVDHFAEINLAGFVELTEALGGIPVCLNAAASDERSGVDLPAGPQTVTGPAALAFVRQRHGLEGGDLDRIARQQAFVAGIAQRLQAAGTLADPTRLARLAGVVTRHVVLDRGWDLDQATAQLARLTGDDLTFQTIPTLRSDLRTPVDGVAVEIDGDAVQAFVRDLIEDDQVAPPAGPVLAPRVTLVPVGSAATAAPSRTSAPTTTAAPTSTPRVISAAGVPCVD